MDRPSTSPSALAARQFRIAWILWGVFCLAASTVIVVDTDRSPVNQSYIDGATRWQAGQPLYTGDGFGFIYPPQAALLHIPFIQFPRPVYEFVWRIATIGLFAVGSYRLARCVQGDSLVTVPALFLLMTALIFPKTWTVAINGQATCAMAGLMMIGCADIAERRWWRAAASLLLALAFKPLAIVLVLLAWALYRPLFWRLSLGGVLFFAVPYLIRDAAYVSAQYAAYLHTLNAAAVIGQQHDMIWPQLFSLLEMARWGVTESTQTAILLTAAVLTLAASWQVSRRFSPPQAAVLLYSLAACYLLLFNPRTENNSYTLLMPPLAAFAARAMLIEKNVRRSTVLASIVLGLSCGFEICRVVTPAAAFVWPCPLGCVVFLGFLLCEIAKPQAWRMKQASLAVSSTIESNATCGREQFRDRVAKRKAA